MVVTPALFELLAQYFIHIRSKVPDVPAHTTDKGKVSAFFCVWPGPGSTDEVENYNLPKRANPEWIPHGLEARRFSTYLQTSFENAGVEVPFPLTMTKVRKIIVTKLGRILPDSDMRKLASFMRHLHKTQISNYDLVGINSMAGIAKAVRSVTITQKKKGPATPPGSPMEPEPDYEREEESPAAPVTCTGIAREISSLSKQRGL